MDNRGEAPRYDHGYFTGSLLASSELLPQAWKACVCANASDDPYFIVDDVEDERVIIAIKGPLVDGSNVFNDGGRFGEFEIKSENDGFFGFLEDDKVLVHKGLFKSSLDLWLKSGIQTQVAKAVQQKKTIVFTGHSLGGAAASFATLSVLEKLGRIVSIFCVTFGSPLIGDSRLGQAIRKRGWDSKVLHEIGERQYGPTTLYCDNLSAIQRARNPIHHSRSKHFDMKHHFIRDMVEKEVIELQYINTEDNIADLFTKGVVKNQF